MGDKIAKVSLNGQTLIDISEDSVTPEVLARDETAHDAAGESIRGTAEFGGDTSDCYKTTDPASTDIADNDYIPFNDVSDVEVPKKKTLFSNIVNKVKNAFTFDNRPKANSDNPVKSSGLYNTISTLLGEAIPADSDLDDYLAEGVYYISTQAIAQSCSHCPIGRSGKLIVMNLTNTYETVLAQTQGDWSTQFYITNHENHIYKRIKTNTAWGDWVEIVNDKSSALITNVGTAIPANSDLNDYTDAGVYKISPDSTAATISNIPIAHGGKLIVMEGVSASETYKMQLFIEHENTYYSRRTTGSGWSDWKQFATIDDISPSSVGDGYAEGTVNGSAITATISGFKLRPGVIVVIKTNVEIGNACTLNISNTGAKSVKNLSGDDPTRGAFIPFGISTYMYDGTYYRYLGSNRLPFVSQQSYVADTSGNILLDWGYGVNRAQLKHNIQIGKLLYNYYKNGAWRGDVPIVDENSDKLIVNYGTNIPDNSNLNDYKNPGTYNVTTNARAATITNNPVPYAGKLIVLNVAQENYRLQCYIVFNLEGSGHGIYFRFWNNDSSADSWTKWFSKTSVFKQGTFVDDTSGSVTLRAQPENTKTAFEFKLNVSNQNLVFNCCNGSGAWIGDHAVYTDHTPPILFCKCETAAATAEKVVTPYKSTSKLRGLRYGQMIAVTFANTNSASNVKLNVDGTGAKDIYYNTSVYTGNNQDICGYSYRTSYYIYDGTHWRWLGVDRIIDTVRPGTYYGTCSSAANAQEKAVTVSDTSFSMAVGTIVHVKFTNGNTFNATSDAKISLNVNSKGAKNIYYSQGYATGTNNTVYGTANRVCSYIYNGTDWVWINGGYENDTSTSARCTTGGGTAAKTAWFNDYKILDKSYVIIQMTAANTVQSKLTMNINGQGAKDIYINGTVSSSTNYTLPAGTYLVYYANNRYYFRTDGKITCAGTVTV